MRGAISIVMFFGSCYMTYCHYSSFFAYIFNQFIMQQHNEKFSLNKMTSKPLDDTLSENVTSELIDYINKLT